VRSGNIHYVIAVLSEIHSTIYYRKINYKPININIGLIVKYMCHAIKFSLEAINLSFVNRRVVLSVGIFKNGQRNGMHTNTGITGITGITSEYSKIQYTTYAKT